MTKENLQQLIGVHNLLFGLSVTGDAIVPLAQALVTLNAIIGTASQSMRHIEGSTDEEATKSKNMEEVTA